MSKSSRKRAGRERRARIAKRADPYELYQQSVQEPSFDEEFFVRIFSEEYGREPRVLREDFCGTAAISCQWVRASEERRAIGFDLDEAPLAWCRANNLTRLDPAQRARVELRLEDARSPHRLRADVISCQNFSFFVFRTRDELRGYFEAARANLADGGLLVLDMVGGSEVLEEDREEITEKDGFDYVWEQHSYDPISAAQVCFIHFRFPDGSSLKRAFRYDWRLWTLPEVRELLVEAGFSRADVYWEGTDESTGEGDGEFRRVERAPSEPAWIAYVVGVR
jgi:hypothetical protein